MAGAVVDGESFTFLAQSELRSWIWHDQLLRLKISNFYTYVAHFMHVLHAKVVSVFVHDSLHVHYLVLMLCNKQSPDQIMHGLLVAIKQHCSDCLNNAVLKDCVLQSEAPPIEEVCNLLAHLQKVLDVCQHGHADFLHFLDVIAIKAHACFEIVAVLSLIWTDCQAYIS